MLRVYPFGKQYRTHFFENELISCEFQYQVYSISNEIFVTLKFESEFASKVMLRQIDLLFKQIGYNIVVISSKTI